MPLRATPCGFAAARDTMHATRSPQRLQFLTSGTVSSIFSASQILIRAICAEASQDKYLPQMMQGRYNILQSRPCMLFTAVLRVCSCLG